MRDFRGYSIRMLDKIKAVELDTVATQLAKFCVENGISTARVAKDLGVSRPSVYAWFTGKRQPRTKTVEQLSKLLDTYRVGNPL